MEARVRATLYGNNGPGIESVVKVVNGKKFRTPHSQVSVPMQLENLYRQYPKAVIDILLQVADGARPIDSITAATYALALVEHPEVAVVVVYSSDEKDYDTVNIYWGRTPRQHWIGAVRRELAKR